MSDDERCAARVAERCEEGPGARRHLVLGLDARLREMDFGPYEGWTEAELEADPVAVTRRRDGAQVPGIEPEDDVAARARSFLASLGDAGGTTLVV
ncbi:MAG TPA: histidine phosphatase family protein, partial [Candidatus Limnocylindrales bacterium]